MKPALAALALTLAAAWPAQAAPTAQQLIAAYGKANENCRGLSPDNPKMQPECDRRERLGGRLEQIGWCYGKDGQAGYQMSWHRCGPGSIHQDDMKETKLPF